MTPNFFKNTQKMLLTSIDFHCIFILLYTFKE